MQRKIEIIGVDTSTLPKISGKECTQYLLDIKNGDNNARSEFIRANLRLVLSLVQRFANGRREVDDLFQVGCVGLIKAINNFDMSHNVQFSTYAVPMIIGEIKRYLRESTGVKVGRKERDIAYLALSTREKLLKNNDNYDDILLEVSKEIDIPISEIAYALDAVSEPKSYYEPVSNEEDGMTLMDTLSDIKNTDERWTENIALSEAIKKVGEREKEILYLRYYLGKTQVEISKIVNISQAQVSRIEKNAIKEIRNYMQ